MKREEEEGRGEFIGRNLREKIPVIISLTKCYFGKQLIQTFMFINSVAVAYMGGRGVDG